MSFTGSATVSQGSDVSKFTITDTSTGSDTNITTRTVSLVKYDGSSVPLSWPLSAGSTLVVSGQLAQDWSYNIIIQWISSSPIPGSTYTFSLLKTFTGNSELFYAGLTQLQVANKNLVNTNNYFTNKSKLRTLIDDAIQATIILGDIYLAQTSLNDANEMIVNQNYYF